MPFLEELKDTNVLGTSLVDPIVRICLPMQRTCVQPLVRELRSRMLQGNQACTQHVLSASTQQPLALQLERSPVPQQRPRAAPKKDINVFIQRHL